MTDSLEQEIRTLRSLYWSARDPEGRAFVPLADAYRRAGEFRQAMELLTEGLDRHPQFASAHVVAARLYLESGLIQEAELASRKVLSLDGENVVGLKCLASSLKAQGRDEEAAELSAQIRELEGEETADGLAGTGSDAGGEPDDGDALDADGASRDVAADEAPVEEAVLEMGDLAPDEEPAAADAEPGEAADLPAPAPDDHVQAQVAEVIPDEPVMDLEDLAPDEADDEAVVELEALAPDEADDEAVMELEALAPDEADDEAVVELEALAPYEADDEAVMDLDALAPDEGDIAAGVAAVVPDEPVIDLEALAPAVDDDIPPYDPEEEDAEPLVTRTLAELYARQGQVERALEVYRQILAATPGDEDLQRRIADLEAGVEPEAEVEAVADEPHAYDTTAGDADIEDPTAGDAAAEDATLPAESATADEGPSDEGPSDVEDVLEHPWDAEDQQELHEVDTPFAWTEQERDEAPAGPPVSAYFARLLAWEPYEAEARGASGGDEEPSVGDAEDARDAEDPDDPEDDGFTSWLNQDEP